MRTLLCMAMLAMTWTVRAQGYLEAMSGYVGTTSDSYTPTESTVFGTIGWTFQPLTSISVTALGAFTYNLPSGSTDVGLWSSDGTLLASSIITSSSTLINQSRYESIAPVMLTAGLTYYLGEFSSSGAIQSVAVDPNELNGPDGYATMASEIQLDSAAWQTNGVFEFPSVTAGSPGSAIIAPNFEFQPVPEPSTLSLAGVSMVLMLARRRYHVF